MKSKQSTNEPPTAGKLPVATVPEVGGQRSAMSLPAADVMLTREEMAAKLKVTLRSIENWQRDGALPYIKIGNAVWFYWPDVIQHLLKHFRVVMPFAGAGNQPVGNGGAQ